MLLSFFITIMIVVIIIIISNIYVCKQKKVFITLFFFFLLLYLYLLFFINIDIVDTFESYSCLSIINGFFFTRIKSFKVVSFLCMRLNYCIRRNNFWNCLIFSDFYFFLIKSTTIVSSNDWINKLVNCDWKLGNKC